MTTRKLVEAQIENLKSKIRTNQYDIDKYWKEIQQGGFGDMESLKLLIQKYDFAKEQVDNAGHDLGLLLVALEASEE